MKTDGYVSAEHRAAMAYATHGIAVFRLAPGTKKTMKGSRGFKDATLDIATVDRWWRETPDAGIAAGLENVPYFVLDVDARNGGHVVWDQLMGLDGALTWLICETGSGWPSAHYWFMKPPSFIDISCIKMNGCPGIDIKGLPYGYVVLPPTVHPTTKQVYSWWDNCDPRIPGVEQLPYPPGWLTRLILESAKPVYPTYRDPSMVPCGLAFPRAIEASAEGLYVGRQIGSSRWMCECPNAAAHTDKRGRGLDSSTVLFAPDRPHGRGHIHCSHGHCEWVK